MVICGSTKHYQVNGKTIRSVEARGSGGQYFSNTGFKYRRAYYLWQF